MSPTRDHRPARSRGFTLVELMVAMGLAAIVFAGILSAFLFMGRSMTRLINLQNQEVASRRAVRLFTMDLSAASQLTTCTVTQVTMTKPTAGGTTTVGYLFNSSAGTLVRSEAGSSRTLLTGLTALSITYFNEGGVAITDSPQSTKAVELAFTTVTGSAASGTRVSQQTVSPRVIFRNKPLLE